MDKTTKRIISALAVENEDQAVVNAENLSKYAEFLKNNIERPCILTGVNNFPWEDKYVNGPGDQKEYEKLKRTRPSYTDEFEVIDIYEEIDQDFGLLINVKRTSDNKGFILELDWLKSVDKKSINFQLIHDYSTWFVNY